MPRLLVTVVVMGVLVTALVPMTGSDARESAAFARWLQHGLGAERSSAVGSALEVANAESATSTSDFVSALARALIAEDPNLAVAIAGLPGATFETILQTLEYLLGSAVEDALLPRTLLIAAKTISSYALTRLSSLEGTGWKRWRATRSEARTPVVGLPLPLPVLQHFLTVIRPQGP